MTEIDRLARLSVLRASGFSGLAILMLMMGTAHDPAASLRYGAGGLVVLSLVMAFRAGRYHRLRRVEETEVWIMLAPGDRPPPRIARAAIVTAMRAQLIEKARWWAMLALCLLALSEVATLAGL